MRKLEDRPWWPELVELKDVMSLRELSARFGAAPAAISNALKRNGIPRDPAPPGARSKRSAAAKQAAAQKLAEMGLEVLPTDAAASLEKITEQPAEEPKAEPEKPGRKGGSRLEAHLDLIGKVIDREVAEKAGVSVSAVAPKEDAAPSAGSCGFRITIGDHEFVVVASDIVEAARIANDSGKGPVRKVELLGSALVAQTA